MALRELEKEEERVQKLISEKRERDEDAVIEHQATLKMAESDKENAEAGAAVDVSAGRKRKKRWDVSSEAAAEEEAAEPATKAKKSRWDQTPVLCKVTGSQAGCGTVPLEGSRWPAHREGLIY